MSNEKDVDVEEVETVECEPVDSGDLVVSSGQLTTDVVDENSEENDRLTVALRSKEDDSSLYDIILEEAAAEAASLKSLRRSARPDDIAAKAIISEKRLAALDKTAKMVSQRSKELKDKNGGKIDFYSENFQRVLEMLVSMIVESVDETGMQKATKDRFLIKMQQKLVGFEEIADMVYKGKKHDSAKNRADFAKTR